MAPRRFAAHKRRSDDEVMTKPGRHRPNLGAHPEPMTRSRGADCTLPAAQYCDAPHARLPLFRAPIPRATRRPKPFRTIQLALWPPSPFASKLIPAQRRAKTCRPPPPQSNRETPSAPSHINRCSRPSLQRSALHVSSPSFMSSTRRRAISKYAMRTRAMQSQKRIRMNYKFPQAMQSANSIQHQFTMRTTRSTLSISHFEHSKAQKSMLLRNTFGSAERKIEVEFILHVNKNVELAHDFFVRSDSD
jgi:hypothetical protein